MQSRSHGRSASQLPWPASLLLLGFLLLGPALLLPGQALARPGMHTIRAEGAGALMVTDPQTARFDFGGGFGLGYELRFLPYLGVEARFSAFFFPSTNAYPTVDGFGSYYAPGLALRGHPLADLDVGDLWISVGAGPVFTGEAILPGIEAGIGFEFDILWWLRAGPFVRYAHTFELETGQNSADAGFLEFGLSVAFLGEEPEAEPEPEPEPPRDTDGDGLNDDVDRCPSEPEDRDEFEDEDGCPDPDNDHDGILDEPDQCPVQAEDRDEFEDEDGCPDPDNDHDGILDTPDRCPNEPETVNRYEDEDGCPDERPEAEARLERLAQHIFFPNDRVRIRSDSQAVLRELIQLLRDHPEIRRIRIEAHASENGSADYNMRLSQRRADRIRESFIEAGIAADRLTTEAFGDTQPEVQGGSEEARAQNRRVVFTILERGPAPGTP